MAFWITALVAFLVVAGILLWPLLRKRQTGDTPEVHPDIQVYRDQLAEIDTDLARSVLSPEAAERTRIEVARRILEADKADKKRDRSVGKAPVAGNIVAAFLVVALGVGAFAIYRDLGANGAPDLPLAKRRAELARQQANRPTQESVEARLGDVSEIEKKADPTYRKLVENLRKAVASRPDDLRGQKLLAEHEARLGHFAAARKAQQRVVKLLGDSATAKDYTDLAELMIVAAGGYVSPKAERALGAAIDLDRSDPRARYYSGLDLAQNGRADLAYKLWSELLDEGPADAPWIKPIRSQIADVARMAGMRLPPPTPRAATSTGPGPTQDQIKAAGKMSASGRQKFIKSMVARLSNRLTSKGGSAAEWAKLINAYGVLGDSKKAGEATKLARKAYAGNDAALATINGAASRAGITD